MDMTGEEKDASLSAYWHGHEAAAVKSFASALVGGVSDNLKFIDEIISKYAKNWQIERMAKTDKNILRIATFELLFSKDIPLKVAINEAIDIAKRYGDDESGKFVNGILDKISKTEDKVAG